ncbi:MFS transporter [Rhodococcus sp. ACT016]|uniref:MFS transporter n=1 Tax=Rhodococcus sp. ACT016 TaxID=3134808 RepID=UPI003D2A4435
MADPTQADAVLRSAIRKSSARLVPLLCLLYALNYLDRVNVGFAAAGMKSDIGLSTAAFGLGAGLFFVGYCIFEVPSNMIMHRVGARLWIARIMVSWGLLASAMSAVQGETSFYVLRVLLGISEAGLLPGIILYLTYWFPAEVRGRTTAKFLLALPISIAVGAPLSSWIISVGDGLFGLAGWQVMFIVQGMPALLIGFAVLFWLPNRPTDARWLTPDERAALTAAIQAEDAAATTRGTSSIRAALRDPRIYLMGIIGFTATFGIYAFSFFMPQVIADFEASFGTPLTATNISILTAIPFACAAVAMRVVSQSSDRRSERINHATIAVIVAAIATVAALYAPTPYLTIAALTILVSAALASVPVFWQIPKYFLSGAAAAGGIGIIGAISNSAGFFAPTVTGWLRQNSGSFDSSMIVMAGLMFAGGLLLLLLRRMLTTPSAETVAALQGEAADRHAARAD